MNVQDELSNQTLHPICPTGSAEVPTLVVIASCISKEASTQTWTTRRHDH